MRSAGDVLKLAGLSHVEHPWLDGADARFCELTTAANAAFESHDDAASRLYEQALAEAGRLFDAALAGGSPLVAPMACTIACHNFAEAKRRAGDLAAAYSVERHAVETLIVTAESPAAPLALRVNCVRHLRHAFAFLAQNLAQKPAQDEENRAELDRLISRYGAITGELARVTAYVMAERHPFEPGGGPAPRQDRLN